MPKLKTHSGTKDRVRITKNGKVLRRKASGNHLLQKKSARRKRTFAGVVELTGTSARNMKRKLGV
ncbi:MAG: 50S ribosomal protein L35 [bacterium]|nr:50S ribosomal protein L35 [bacterium]